MEHDWFRLEFQLPDGKDALQTTQKCYQLKIQMLSAVYRSFALVTLIWVYLILSYFFLKALCTRLLILDFNRSRGIEV